MSLRSRPATQVALAMAAGFAAGIVLRETAVPRVVEPVGTLWINAIRMPVLPLIVAMLIASIGGSRDPRAIGTLGARTLGVMLAVLSLFAVIMVPLSVLLLGGLTFDPASTASLREAAGFDPALLQQVSLREWLLSLVPNNPIRAAADGALLPLVIFSLAYGLALSRVSDGTRETHVRFCQGVADAMTTVIGWVVRAAPVGVFALAVSVGAHLGASAAGAIIVYILACVVCLAAALALLYVVAWQAGGVRPGAFAAAVLPAQTIAFTSRSSLAALPVLLTDARAKLGIPEPIAGFVLPLCASIFKPNSPITWPLGAVLVAQLYGVEFGGVNLLVFGIGSIILSLTVPGIPSGGFFVQAPLYLAVNLPPEGLGILIAVDFVPDLFKTLLNLTSYASTALVVSRRERRESGPSPA
ncbi:MAG: dicarboxylate/amino acid:cation symporter [Gemmatimonadaceae bacterium]|nr:dicarboxylate/amino acid:cation symporter [Gemmatimonadaceae bacterium]